MKIKVMCTLELLIDWPYDTDINLLKFQIEENGCPGSGIIGYEIKKTIETAEKGQYCWACNLKGKNKIIGIVEDDK